MKEIYNGDEVCALIAQSLKVDVDSIELEYDDINGFTVTAYKGSIKK